MQVAILHLNKILSNNGDTDIYIDYKPKPLLSLTSNINETLETNYNNERNNRMYYMLLNIVNKTKFYYNKSYDTEFALDTSHCRHLMSDHIATLSNNALTEYTTNKHHYPIIYLNKETEEKYIIKKRNMNNESIIRQYKRSEIIKKITVNKLLSFLRILDNYKQDNENNMACYTLYDNILYDFICNNHINDKKMNTLGTGDIVMLKYISNCYIDQITNDKKTMMIVCGTLVALAIYFVKKD